MLLVVDDDPGARRALARLGRRYGPVMTARTAEEALRLIETWPAISGVVADYNLGRRSGLEVLEAAARRHPWAPCALATGEDTEALDEAASALGAIVLRKPFGLAEFEAFERLRAIRRAQVPLELEARIEACAVAAGFRPLATELFALVASGLPREGVQRRLGLDEASFEELSGEVLGLAKLRTLHELVGWVRAWTRGEDPNFH